MVDEQPERRTSDDRADEQAAETEKVATAQRRRLEIVWHPPKLTHVAGPGTGRMAPGWESRIAVVSMAAVLCQRAVVAPGGKSRPNACETYHERALPLKWIDQGSDGPWSARLPGSGWAGVDTLGSRKVSESVTATITASATHIHGPV